MKIKAVNSIIEFDGGNMVVINAGETGELSDAKAEQHIAAGNAKPVKVKAPTAAQLAAEAEAAAAAEAEAVARIEAAVLADVAAEAANDDSGGDGEGAPADEAPAE